MAAKKKGAGGRPSNYKEDYARMAGILAKRGLTDAELADVKEQTVNNWKKAHPEFFESLKHGKEEFDARVEMKLAERAMGYTHKEVKLAQIEGTFTDAKEVDKHYPPDVTACIFWLKNRKPDEWRDKVEQETTHKGAIKVTIGGDA